MEIQNTGKEDRIQTASGVIEGRSHSRDSGENEQAQSFRRRGRKGAAQSAQGLDSDAVSKSHSGEQEGSGQFRVVITREANESLEAVVKKVNAGFDAGAVGRTEIAIYVFLNLPKFLSDADIKNIRSQNFDEKRVLGSLLKSNEELPEDLRRALREHYGISEKEKRRTLRVATSSPIENYENDPSAA